MNRLKAAGVSGLILVGLVIIGIVALLLYLFLSIPNADTKSVYEFVKPIILYGTIISFVAYPFQVFYLYGYILLGRLYNQKLLIHVGWIWIVVALISLLVSISTLVQFDSYIEYVSSGYSVDIDETTQMKDIASKDFVQEFKQSKSINKDYVFLIVRYLGISAVLPIAILLFLGKLALKIVGGIGFLKLRKNGLNSGLAGGFEIASGVIRIDFLSRIFVSLLFLKSSSNSASKKSK